MNRIKRFIVNRKIVQRLIQLDGILKESHHQAMLARMFSRTKGGMWQRSREKHRSLIDSFNENKLFFMKRRKYDI